uniref:Uncharacterized protein n=1 Tax=Anguilla anguilla TaxID=7936 RepID=A0A0E9SPB5_ANGAN
MYLYIYCICNSRTMWFLHFCFEDVFCYFFFQKL